MKYNDHERGFRLRNLKDRAKQSAETVERLKQELAAAEANHNWNKQALADFKKEMYQ